MNRREFLRVGVIGGGLTLLPFKGIIWASERWGSHPGRRLEDIVSNIRWASRELPVVGSPLDDVTDYADITVDPDLANSDVRILRDPRVDYSVSGGYIRAYGNDDIGYELNWELMGWSQNIDGLNPIIGGNIFGADPPPPASMAGTEYTMLYRGLDFENAPSGTARVLDEIIDRYFSIMTIDYKWKDNNGNYQHGQISFQCPQDALLHLMEWNEPPVPVPPPITFNPQHQYFPTFFQHLQELLQAPQSGDPALEKAWSRLVNRMTPAPCPDPNPAYADLAALDAISQGNVLLHDDIYPTLVGVEMVDWTQYAGSQAGQKGSSLLKPGGITGVTFSPPMGNHTIRTNMLGINNQNDLGWMHSYLVQTDPGHRPLLTFSGVSPLLQPSYAVEEVGPDTYLVHVLLQTGDTSSPQLENLAIHFDQTTGIDPRRPAAVPETPLVVSHNFPEPFNPRTTVKYDVTSPSMLDVSIYDILGRHVETLYHGRHEAGKGFEMIWEPQGKASGVYLMRFTAPGYVKSERMILLR